MSRLLISLTRSGRGYDYVVRYERENVACGWAPGTRREVGQVALEAGKQAIARRLLAEMAKRVVAR